jgi:ribonucleoside-diphosphate reductase alpha chain
MPKTSKKAATKKIVRKSPISKVLKRDGSVVDYDIDRIVGAIHKAMIQTGEGDLKEAEFIARKVESELKKVAKYAKSFVPSVEGVQDLVEQQLMAEDYTTTAKSYILYREERSRMRKVMAPVPEKVRKLTEESRKYFRNPLAEFIFFRTYARWIESESRRETWIETVGRYIDFMRENLGDKLTEEEYEDVRQGILNQEAMPSMRLLQFAGKAARKTNVCAYNCSYIAPTKLQDFGEIMYLSMCGTGVGFSVESITAQQLPIIQKQTGKMRDTYVVDDSKEGWADALVHGLKTWFAGEDVEFDYSLLRPAGARLKTMGGKSSGPDPLRSLMVFSREKILKKQGKRLTNLDVHDVVCKIGEIVVSGGVRRSALISLSDLDDNEMRHAKDGQFYATEPQRMLANNSAVYLEKPSSEEFVEEWLSLMKGGSGERGIFNRGALRGQLPKRRLKVTNPDETHMGANPCGEILLRSKQFCNLSEVVARDDDTEKSLLRKARLATIIGTYQSSLTNFGYLSKEWKKNCEEEALLGVSVTGQWDSENSRNASILQKIRDEVIKVNKEYAKKFGINQSTAVTSVKPSGTVSQLVDSSSGMHPRHSKYYIRRVRISATDSLFKMLKDQGVPYHPEVGQSMDTATTYVLEFPVKAPSHAQTFKDDLSALEQLEHWKKVKVNYTEHNPSITISVGADEWITVANWLYENWDILGGLSFLPRSDHVYQLAPYETITKKQYEEIAERFEHIDFSKIVTYEKADETEVKRELACVAGTCEV